MDFLNDSDLLSECSFETPSGRVTFPAQLRGYADSVSVEQVPTPDGMELVIEFRAEAGHTGAVIRLRDVLELTRQHYPELLGVEQAKAGEAADEGGSGYREHYGYR